MRPSAIAAVILAAATAAAQVELPRMTEIVEVRILNFDVVVTDRNGNHIRGLAKEDFEILESGKQREITNFSEFGPAIGELKSEEAPPRHIVLFVDVFSTTTFERKRATAALAEFIKEVRPDDEVMIMSWNRRLKIETPPTSDHAKLNESLSRVAREASADAAARMMRERQKPSENAATVKRMYERAELNELTQSASALNSVLTKLAGVSGRKVLVMVTKGFAIKGDPSEDQTSDTDTDAARIVASVARRANAAGVTLYAVHGARLESGMSVEDSEPDSAVARIRQTASSVDGLRYLAGRTGGLVIANTNDATRGLKLVAADLATYYSLGYKANARRVDIENNIEIRTRDRNLRVRARRGFVEQTFDSEIAHQLIANLFFPISSNALQVSAQTGAKERQRRNRYGLPVDVTIPYASLTFTPEGSEFVADLSIFIGASDIKGGTSEIRKFDHKIRLAKDQLGKVAAQHYKYGLDVDLVTIGGDQRIAVAVLDNLSTMTGFATVEAKQKP